MRSTRWEAALPSHSGESISIAQLAASEAEPRVREDQVAVARKEVGLGGLVHPCCRRSRWWSGWPGRAMRGWRSWGRRGRRGRRSTGLGWGRDRWRAWSDRKSWYRAVCCRQPCPEERRQETSDQAQQPDYRSPRSFHRLFLPTAKASPDRRTAHFPLPARQQHRRLAVFPRDRGGLWREKREVFGVAEG